MAKVKFEVAQKLYKIPSNDSTLREDITCMDDIQWFIEEMCLQGEKVDYIGIVDVVKFYKIDCRGYGDVYRIIIKAECKKDVLKRFILALFCNRNIGRKFSLQRMY